ncbi:MAG: peptide-methionine (S)-S-oxide reductase [Alphaproteobacteria bacterium]|mgnify:CR=1 FL=1|jgi:peptide-methionine (S)-S-oxide reductase|nr:peptide-methionine (S)-S-oxide reductase [Rhodospirillaceae bacterium]MDG2479791.1 peptide-methionine (S)-S-oxide reductase [Alphaproteobacteria bacterium]MBT6205789.1 peptide-methionine (S)-S-oxide reductase [Rhodospirillaceae bacterium]MBT6511650.1 peptide-methionine (S)-S-oxide reductase [Rhodospirillaceae bacterium]MBT7613873.1 peptide-methionine (S)-S-oxide reductase [Rhodospirillaceae bacterium]
MAIATYAMGCFWGSQDLFEGVPGVLATEVGFANGERDDVEEAVVFSGDAGHAEVVVVTYDERQIGYGDLLGLFWENHNPTGEQRSIVRSALIVHNDEQRCAAEASVAERRGGGARTTVEEAGRYWRASDGAQHYLARQRQAEAAE